MDLNKPATGAKVTSKIGAGKFGLKKPAHPENKEEHKAEPAHEKPSETKEKVQSSYKMELKKPVEEEKPQVKEAPKQEKITQSANVVKHTEETPIQSPEKQPDKAEVVEEHHLQNQPVDASSEEKSVHKKVFKKPEVGDGDSSTQANTSNLKMLQHAKVEIVKKDSLISKLTEELKELCKSHFLLTF